MAIYKRQYGSGKIRWCYVFDAPWSTPDKRDQMKHSGFETKKKAEEAEAIRRVEVAAEHSARLAVVAPLPRNLSELLAEYFRECSRNLAPKTLERYREHVEYVDSSLRSMPLSTITPLHLSREWNRLLVSGGRHRKTKAPRPLKAKTVRAIASVVSVAYRHAVTWGLVSANPVADSDPPVFKRKKGHALTPAQQALVISAAQSSTALSGGLAAFLEMDAATGVRRGELLALRWSDISGDFITSGRSLSQVKSGLHFKETKEGVVNEIALPDSALVALAEHRRKQDIFRGQFGPDYRADLDLVFCNPDGTPLRPDSVSAAVSLHFRKLKFPIPASLHTLRHSHGSHLLAAGVSLPEVSKRLGHKSVYTTAEIYSHALPGSGRDAARKWQEFQKRGGVTAGSQDSPLGQKDVEAAKPQGAKFQ